MTREVGPEVAPNDPAAMRQMIEAMRAMGDGDFSVRLPGHWTGLEGELANAINGVVTANQHMVQQLVRVAREVGTEGVLGGQAEVSEMPEAPDAPGRRVVRGAWRELTDSVNSMAANVTAQARQISEVTHAVAHGDLSKKVTVEARGEIAQLKGTINTMVDHLGAFVTELTRVAREVGEGKLDGRAEVPGVAGVWRDVTDGANTMIEDLRLTTARSIEATQRTEALLAQSQQLAAELQQRNAQLAQQAQELALTSRYKSEFLANMSHELRTPLNSILMLGQQLSENATQNLTARQIDFARTIHAAGADLLALINDILDLSKIESGTVTVELDDVRFTALLDSLARPFRYEAERRGLSFEISIDPGLGRSLTTDAKRLQQILKNLLSNAFKFTEVGGVRLAVSSAGSRIAFEVSDTGIGIDPEKQRLVFESFQQADSSTSRKYGGTGLGLAISRELTTLLGGELALRSTPGVGSAFTLTLPDEARPRPSTARAPAPLAAVHEVKGQPPRSLEDLRGRKLLVVDDDVRNLFALGAVVERHGMQLVTAQSGREALAILDRTRDISAVLMDIMMPELDGYETIQLIRQQPAQQRLPIIALTAKAMHGDREKCLEAGASDYLAKPVSADQLLDTLRTWLPR